MIGLMDGWMDEGILEWMDEWTDKEMSGWIESQKEN